MRHFERRKFLSASALLGGSILSSSSLLAQEPPKTDTTEPFLRLSSNGNSRQNLTAAHPLDPAIQMAYGSLQNIRSTIADYTAIMVKRERVGGKLGDQEYMGVKIRNRQVENGRIKTPFSVYITFLKPTSVKGREVIFVEDQNNGKLVAHEGGMKGRFLPTVTLPPTGMMAMRGQRYPITDMGIENLVVKLIEKGERDRKQGLCSVEFHKNVAIGGRTCTALTVTHKEKRPCFDFHIAQIFIDDELNIPIRYCAYEWPKIAGGKPELLEEYTYFQIKTNVGLTDRDFDRNNPKYKF